MADSKSRTAALGKATNAANGRLKKAHLNEWNGYMAEEAEVQGENWTPKASAEAKAERDLERLITQYPHLAEKIRSDGLSVVI